MILTRHAVCKGWPPRPGSTQSTSTTSHSPLASSGAMADVGVPGARQMPAEHPAARISRARDSASAVEESDSHLRSVWAFEGRGAAPMLVL